MMAKPWLNVALAYHKLGKPVIPLCPPDPAGMTQNHLAKCTKPGKTPLVAGWQRYGRELPTTEELQKWTRQWLQANIGGPTGPLWGVALDIDLRSGGGISLEERWWTLPDTVQNLTAHGYHCIFTHPGVHVGCSPLAKGTDVRGDGGQICLPPSIHASGHIYAWELSNHPSATATAPMPKSDGLEKGMVKRQIWLRISDD